MDFVYFVLAKEKKNILLTRVNGEVALLKTKFSILKFVVAEKWAVVAKSSLGIVKKSFLRYKAGEILFCFEVYH